MTAGRGRGLWALPLSMFIGTFAWSFIQVSLPFYIGKISTLDAAATLRWTGWILGVSLLATTLFAWLRPAAVYVTVAALGLLVVPPGGRPRPAGTRGKEVGS